MELAVLISWLLVSALSMVTAAFQQSPYCPVSNETGSILCATDVPSSILTDTSKTRCSLECMSSPGSCAAFNYNTASRECGLFNRTLTGFRSDANCTSYVVGYFYIKYQFIAYCDLVLVSQPWFQNCLSNCPWNYDLIIKDTINF